MPVVDAADAPLVIAIRSFPGVRLRYGHWCTTAVPVCGCDACDEDAEDAIAHLRDMVTTVVEGKLQERLSRHPRRLWVGDDASTGWSAIDQEQYEKLRALAAPGAHVWAPWPALPGRGAC